ncbi:hypothetical protein [Lacipirellula parvula]|uniref:hypothetical protein n=1 Tax=Lacipirellula parvula TaxID=2650471 RepID=UPI0012612524|nr:hypothetical protein [Lacipirellula parvula]
MIDAFHPVALIGHWRNNFVDKLQRERYAKGTGPPRSLGRIPPRLATVASIARGGDVASDDKLHCLTPCAGHEYRHSHDERPSRSTMVPPRVLPGEGIVGAPQRCSSKDILVSHSLRQKAKPIDGKKSLASAPSPFEQFARSIKVDKSHEHAEALLLTCIDFRFFNLIARAMDEKGLSGKYDHFILAGAA